MNMQSLPYKDTPETVNSSCLWEVTRDKMYAFKMAGSLTFNVHILKLCILPWA